METLSQMDINIGGHVREELHDLRIKLYNSQVSHLCKNMMKVNKALFESRR